VTQSHTVFPGYKYHVVSDAGSPEAGQAADEGLASLGSQNAFKIYCKLCMTI